ncbi:hypothetical protein M8J75_012970 [Diaphorina citri]|nr:hypothetical protein M8J75_012970 [Diaphorina citri]
MCPWDTRRYHGYETRLEARVPWSSSGPEQDDENPKEDIPECRSSTRHDKLMLYILATNLHTHLRGDKIIVTNISDLSIELASVTLWNVGYDRTYRDNSYDIVSVA